MYMIAIDAYQHDVHAAYLCGLERAAEIAGILAAAGELDPNPGFRNGAFAAMTAIRAEIEKGR